MENEGEFKKRIHNSQVPWDKYWVETKSEWSINLDWSKIDKVVDEAKKEYPKVSQRWVPVKGKRVDWKGLCKMMELRIIEFETFGKKWFGE